MASCFVAATVTVLLLLSIIVVLVKKWLFQNGESRTMVVIFTFLDLVPSLDHFSVNLNF